jgi:DNA-directed RNA polymerase subunit RPC12/RpoP
MGRDADQATCLHTWKHVGEWEGGRSFVCAKCGKKLNAKENKNPVFGKEPRDEEGRSSLEG